jgi:Right handed beta helix region
MLRNASLRRRRRAAAVAAALAVAAAAAIPGAGAAELVVGPGMPFAMPSAAAAAVHDGDTVRIAGGVYRDCAVWKANRLRIVAVAGAEPHVDGVACQGKALWIVRGRDVSIEGIRFSRAAVPARNGAGIFVADGTLTLRRVRFHDNENGILTANRRGIELTIEDSVFERNGKCEPQCAHGIYVGRGASLLRIFRSTFHEQRVGHHIKSRARRTEIVDCVIEDGPAGTASYAINIPDGGTAEIRGNRIEKGPRSDNPSAIVAIGEEGGDNPGLGYVVEGNRVRSDLPAPTIFVRNRSNHAALLRGNILDGPVVPLTGPGRVK